MTGPTRGVLTNSPGVGGVARAPLKATTPDAQATAAPATPSFSVFLLMVIRPSRCVRGANAGRGRLQRFVGRRRCRLWPSDGRTALASPAIRGRRWGGWSLAGAPALRRRLAVRVSGERHRACLL